jgi:hypothetical protein
LVVSWNALEPENYSNIPNGNSSLGVLLSYWNSTCWLHADVRA